MRGRNRDVTSENNDTARGRAPGRGRGGGLPWGSGGRKKSWPPEGRGPMVEVREGARMCHADWRVSAALWAVM